MGSAYAYKVRDKTGKVLTGSTEGPSEESVISQLKERGFLILNVRKKGKSPMSMEISLPFFGSRVKLKDLTIFSRQFATMINSGLSLTRALAVLGEQARNLAFKKIIQEVAQDVQGGQALSEALAKHPKVFPKLYVTMVKAGEIGGVLDTVLVRVADHFETEAELRGKVKAASAYPLAVFSFTILIAFSMITFIVPMFVKMFASFEADLPLPTRFLLYLSGSIRTYWWLYAVILVAAVYAFRVFKASANGRYRLDQVKLKLPIFGQLFNKIAASRFSRTLSTLISAGVPVLHALEIVAETAGNAVVERAVAKCRSEIREGETIASPLSKSGVFAPMVVQMIGVGEESGNLEGMLAKVADFYDTEVSAAVDALTSLIEPLLIIVMGLVVAGILISLYLPMFNIVGLVK